MGHSVVGTHQIQRRVTLIDVAQAADVSRATVSLVLRNSPLVADRTRARVHAAMTRLGYIYHRGAATLRTQRSGMVGLIITDLANPFFAELTAGVEAALEAEQRVVIIGSSGESVTKQERFLATLQEHGVDGLLLCPARGTPASTVMRVAATLPTVLVVREVVGMERAGEVSVDYVGADYVAGAAMATAHLLSHGHQRIAFVGGPPDSSARHARLGGYRAALTGASVAVDDALIVESPVTREGGRTAMLQLLASAQPPTAALCYNDVVAFGAMLALRAAGVRVGQEFGVIGADDIAEAALWQPPLSTVALHPRRVGELAARQLLVRLAGEEGANRTILAAELMLRASCGCKLD